jgi:DNA-binding MarR family transcriptional regulator
MDIKDNPGFLLHKIGALMERTSDLTLFNEFGIGYSQFKILFALSHHEGVQQKEIAQFLGQTEASISRQIKLLREARFITITLGQDDKKKHLIALTSKGQNLLTDALGTLNRFYEPMLSSLSPKAQLELAGQLGMIHDSLMGLCETTIKKD